MNKISNQQRAERIISGIESRNDGQAFYPNLTTDELALLKEISDTPDVTAIIERPKSLPCKLFKVKDKDFDWLVFVGLKDEKVFEIFVGEYRKDEDIMPIHERMVTGEIIKTVTKENKSIYTLRTKDKHGYCQTFEGLNRVFDNEYFNETITISFMLRYFPNEKVIHVIKKWKGLSEKMEKFREVVVAVLEKFV